MEHPMLPSDFDEQLRAAVKLFWSTRKAKGNTSVSQGGTRGQVLSGKHLDGFLHLTRQVALHSGLPESAVISKGGNLILPGYFRATKSWDIVIWHQGRLLAAIELKSQVGSFGKNQNNRIEEVVGLGHDFWTANKHRLEPEPASMLAMERPYVDPRPPFVGYLLLLEDAPDSRRVITRKAKLLRGDPALESASYIDRYDIMAQRLMSERLFTAAAVMTSPADEGAETGSFGSVHPSTNVYSFFKRLAAELSAAV